MDLRITWAWFFLTLAVLVPLLLIEAPRFVHTSIDDYFQAQRQADMPCCSAFEFLWLFMPHTLSLMFASLAVISAKPSLAWLKAARVFALGAAAFLCLIAAAFVYRSFYDDWTSDPFLESPLLGKLIVMPVLLTGPVALVSLMAFMREFLPYVRYGSLRPT